MKTKRHIPTLIFMSFLFSLLMTGNAQTIRLTNPGIIATTSIKSPVRETIIRVLKEEIEKRTGISIPEANGKKRSSLIIIAGIRDSVAGGLKVPDMKTLETYPANPEGFRVFSDPQGRPYVWLIGNDDRGALFAAGYFLRKAELSHMKICFSASSDIETHPEYAIRGHQIGYRNTANSWDAWTVGQYEQYIRELALFGSNCIENIPFQDGPPGPNMKVPRDVMNNEMSRICNDYGLDYWVWTPADADLADSVKFNAEVRKHSEFYKSCPRLDGVFFPGGDPGNNHPRYVLPFLKAVAAELKKYHPTAGVWLSLQGFNEEEVDYFYSYLEKFSPDWLTGIVSGPSSPDMAATRYRLPAKYRHRHYPDLTHTVRCLYPAENWDQAFALTEGREVCNPQPVYYAKVHNRYAPLTDGFLSYSDGVHDDVNKVVWSSMAWDPGQDVNQVLEDYCRLFFGSAVAIQASQGILALERNWVGPVEENGSIETTFSFWKTLERANPDLAGNWRWQQLVMRSYYDTYVKRRKIYEQGLEKEANSILATAPATGSEAAMSKALELVSKADDQKVSPELRQKVFDYCEALNKSVGMQTSVKKYNASGAERGAILDFIDYPLNNRWWLADEFNKISSLKTEAEKLARLEIIRTWENPGPGSFYDNVGDLSKGSHVKSRTDDGTEYAWWDNGMSRRRLSTQLFQTSPVLEYPDLDPNGRYIIRISGYGDALIRVDGERLDPVVYNKGMEEFKEFLVPRRCVSDGTIRITFDQPEESHLNWRQQSKVCDVWLLKSPGQIR